LQRKIKKREGKEDLSALCVNLRGIKKHWRKKEMNSHPQLECEKSSFIFLVFEDREGQK